MCRRGRIRQDQRVHRHGDRGPTRWLLAAATAVALLGGCAQQVTGVPAPAPGASSGDVVAPAPPAPAPAASPVALAPVTGGCEVTIAGSSIRMSGGGRVRTINGAHQLACRNGPLLGVQSVAAEGVRFQLDDQSVLVAAGATAEIGAYRITVKEIDAPTAEFALGPTG
jgi:hypothetical protein